MIRKMVVPGVKFPDLYLVHNLHEAKVARDAGLPYYVVPSGWDDDMVLKIVFFRVLQEMFPMIDWYYVFNLNNHDVIQIQHRPVTVIKECTRDTGATTSGEINDDMVVVEGDGYREGVGGVDKEVELDSIDLIDYVGAEWSRDVDIDVLQCIGMLPTFMDDITESIRRNLSSVAWHDGWNKKLDANMGSIQPVSQAPNLMVLDVSGSIPGGVAVTMVKLIETLRTQANADLIITSFTSKWYGIDDPMPTPSELAYLIGGGNEIVRFSKLLVEHMSGKHYGNLVVFGDDDSPQQARFMDDNESLERIEEACSSGLSFDNILAFHTRSSSKVPGYGRFALKCSPHANVDVRNDWVRCMI